MPRILWTDTETRSHCDLKTKGVYNYAAHPTTEVLCLSYAFDDDEVQTWTPVTPLPASILEWTGQIRAHNAAFERLIFWRVLGLNYALEQFYCTAAQARANCAPGSLEDAGRFAGADMQKDHRGAQLIRKLCVPPYVEDETLKAELIAYCEQDVRAMRALSQSLRDLTPDELADYHTNERINDRGVMVDTRLCRAAVRYAEAETEDIQARVAELTEGAVTSVRSGKLREWVLARLGAEARALCVKGDKASLDKSVRANLLAFDNPEQVPPEVREVVECADDLWASSVAKFQRLADLADRTDHRVRGAFVFAGGAATGRAASYGAQVHNFPRKAAKSPEAVRADMVAGQPIVPAHGRRVTDVLRSMLRPALVPAPGHRFVVADWAAIEGRVNPWLAGTDMGERKLDIYRRGDDIYKVNAAATFGVRYDEVSDEQRQVGKVQELACFSAETKVLTNRGAKAIVDVTTKDLLWDGETWVTHQGVIAKGLRKTINVCGVHVTEDHLFWVGHEWKDAKTVHLSKKLRTQALEAALENLPFWAMEHAKSAHVRFEWSLFNAHVAQNLIGCNFIICLKARLKNAIHALKSLLDTGAKIGSPMRTCALMTLYGVGFLTAYRRPLCVAPVQKQDNGTDMAVEALPSILNGLQTKLNSLRIWSALKGMTTRSKTWTGLTSTKDTNLETYGFLRGEKTVGATNEPFTQCKKEFSNLRPVFDILNSGSRNRFTILTDKGPLIAHNCGFAGGVGAFAAMGRAYSVHLSETTSKQMVRAWRLANPWAVRWWHDLEGAYTSALRHPGREFTAGRVVYIFEPPHLWYMLPSGRILCYPFARFEQDGISYAKASWKPAADAKEWPRARLWTGTACENVTQAAAHDLLRGALRRLPEAVLHVHDEIVLEVPEADADAAARLVQVMCEPPAWAEGLPLKAEVKVLKRYGK